MRRLDPDPLTVEEPADTPAPSIVLAVLLAAVLLLVGAVVVVMSILS